MRLRDTSTTANSAAIGATYPTWVWTEMTDARSTTIGSPLDSPSASGIARNVKSASGSIGMIGFHSFVTTNGAPTRM